MHQYPQWEDVELQFAAAAAAGAAAGLQQQRQQQQQQQQQQEEAQRQQQQQQQHLTLCLALVRFYTRHNPAKIPGVPAVVAWYIHRQDELNRSLVELYGEGLASAHELHAQQVLAGLL
jgi:hypothetical protein